MQHPPNQFPPNQYPPNPYPPYSYPPYQYPPTPYGMPPRPDECSMAMVSYILAVFTGFLGPLIFYVIKKNQSTFVAFHAMQSLFMAVIFLGVSLLSAVLFVVGIAVSVAMDPQAKNPPALFFITIIVCVLLSLG